MLQHPIPQNVSAYRFRLVGDMTLKQFLLLMSGFVPAVFFYSSNLFSVIKWSLILISVAAGAAAAFVPIEERPLDQWLLAFLKAIFNPTLYTWHKSAALPDYFTHQAHAAPQTVDLEERARVQAARRQAGLTSFLQTLPNYKAQSAVEDTEDAHIQSILGLFNQDFTAKKSFAPRPTRDVTVPKPHPPASFHAPTPAINLPVFNTTSTAAPAPATPGPKSPSPLKTAQYTPAPQAIQGPISIPKAPKTPVPTPQAVPQTTQAPQPQPTQGISTTKTPSTTTAATTAKDLPFPSAPTTKNTVVGMVLDPQGQIIDNAIIEIRDKQAMPVRATKTNRLGQFFISTPLKNGTYEIEIESPNHTFAVQKLKLNGNLVDPLKITAKT